MLRSPMRPARQTEGATDGIIQSTSILTLSPKGDVRQKILKWSTVIGAFLVYLPSGLNYYWGNLAIYVNSYYYDNIGRMPNFEVLVLVNSLYAVCDPIGLPLAGVFSRRLSHRVSLLIGIVILEISVFSSFYFCQTCPIGLALAMGGLNGLGSGIIYGEIMHCVNEWCSDDIGFMSGIVTSGVNVGPILINLIITMSINPNNTEPDVNVDIMKAFSQHGILEQVPRVFLLIAGFGLIVHCYGLALIHYKSTDQTEDKDSTSIVEPQSTSQTGDDAQQLLASESSGQCATYRESTPKQMLKSASFYAIWFTFFSGEYANIVLLNFNKTFGQQSIKDDVFLTTVNNGITFGSIPARILWGIIIDRCGVKCSVVIYSASVALLNAFWYSIPSLGGKWLYLVYTTALGCVDVGMYVLISVCALKMFGKSHFNTNCSILFTSLLVLNLVAPPIQQLIMSLSGYFCLFLSVVVASLISLILNVVFLPEI